MHACMFYCVDYFAVDIREASREVRVRVTCCWPSDSGFDLLVQRVFQYRLGAVASHLRC